MGKVFSCRFKPDAFEVRDEDFGVLKDGFAYAGIVLEAVEDDECELAWLPRSAKVSDEQVKLGRALVGKCVGESKSSVEARAECEIPGKRAVVAGPVKDKGYHGTLDRVNLVFVKATDRQRVFDTFVEDAGEE